MHTNILSTITSDGLHLTVLYLLSFYFIYFVIFITLLALVRNISALSSRKTIVNVNGAILDTVLSASIVLIYN